MTPVDQEFVYIKDVQSGDCLRACVASLLDLPLAEVPHFVAIAERDGGSANLMCAEFIEARGYEFRRHTSLIYYLREGQDIYHMISGPSPRSPDIHHAIIGLNGKPFFDPHPDKTFLAGEEKQWQYSFIVKVDK